MKTILKPNPKYQGSVDSERRLNTALEKAFERDPQLRFEYDTELLTLHIAKLVRSLRAENHITQFELAERIGVSQSFVARIENPKADKEPNLQTLAKLAHAFGKKLVIEWKDERISR